MVKRCSAFLLIGLLAACSPEKTATPAAPQPPLPTGPEQLLADAPTNWQQSFRTEGPGIRMVEFAPANADSKDWTDKVSFESFSGTPLPDPIELLTSIASDQRKTCNKFTDHETFSGLENGYPTSVRLFICDVNPLTNKGQLTLVKTIKGDQNFYVITRARRTAPIQPDPDGKMPAEAKTIAEWSLYLHAISACNTADSAHPCPPQQPDATANAPAAPTPTAAPASE
jgi:hypothetical protein